MYRPRPSVLATLVASLALVAAACGGDDAGSSPVTTPAPAVDEAADQDAPADSYADDDDTDDDIDDDASAGGADLDEYVPGTDQIRVVNLLDDPVDVYVRTTDGLVVAFLLEAGLAPGGVSDYLAPPDPGRLIVTEAGAGDATCVSTCPHILSDVRTGDDTGPVITSIVYFDQFANDVRSLQVWETPPPGDSTLSNRMPDPDPSIGLFIPVGAPLSDADFGLRVSYAGIDGCQENRDQVNALVGGSSTLPYAYDGASVEVLLHDNTDRDCVEAPVGGPFTISGGPGTRVLLVLTGSPGDMDAVILALSGDVEGAAPSTDGDDASGSDDDATGASADVGAVVDALDAFLGAQLPLSPTETACLAAVIVGQVGADALTDPAGGPVDFDFVSPELEDQLIDALIVGIDDCGVDPSLFE